ncbi:MAG: tetratricopeptide repeat protein [candidate division KSB1 bacterium]|nr:tetratricopeptide repeat protein [candidate division KSB1 bacterium]
MLLKSTTAVVLLMMVGCASQKSAVMPQWDGAWQWLTQWINDGGSASRQLDEKTLSNIATKLDSLCDHEIVVPEIRDFETLPQQIEELSRLDNQLLQQAAAQRIERLPIAWHEYQFRALAKMQVRMQDSFENDAAYVRLEANRSAASAGDGNGYRDFEAHGRWVFKQRVSQMLPYIQANQQLSTIKTNLLNELVNSLPAIENATGRKRAWLALDRMLNEVDLQKSAADYEPFQRSARGIYLAEADFIRQLRAQQARESQPEVVELATRVIQKIDAQQQQPLDEEFLQQLAWSEEVKRRLQTDSVKTIDGLTAAEWIEKGNSARNDQLKIKYLSNAIQLNPNYAPAYNHRGNAYQSSGQDALALQDYSKAISLDPKFEPAYFNRGNILEKLNQFEPAIADFSKTLDFQPRNALAYFHRGRCYKGLNKFPEALEDFNKAIQIDPSSAAAYNNRADIYRKLKDDEAAIRDYTRAIELDPGNKIAYNNRGLTYAGQGKHQEAIRDYEQAIKIAPDYAAAYYNLGTAHWSLKNWPEVVAAWEKYLKLEPNDKQVREWLAFVRRQFKPK